MATTLGIDCSVWQDNDSTPQMMDFAKSKAAGAKFVFIKASQGGALDGDYVNNWLHAEGVLPRGAYHFYDWRVSYSVQINLFCQIVENDPGELPPALDYESRINVPIRATAAGIALRFLKDVEQRTGRTPLLYTSPGFWGEFGLPANTDFAKFPLWVANYGVYKPSVPKPWTNWTFWQYSSTGDGLKFGAESKSLDMDYFNGAEDEFKVWAGLVDPAPEEMTLEQRVERIETALRAHGLM